MRGVFLSDVITSVTYGEQHRAAAFDCWYVLSKSPALWIGLVFVFSLLIGSFLNVVIHRVPIMLDREWRSQAEQILSEQRTADSGQQEHVGLKADLQHSGPPAPAPSPQPRLTTCLSRALAVRSAAR